MRGKDDPRALDSLSRFKADAGDDAVAGFYGTYRGAAFYATSLLTQCIEKGLRKAHVVLLKAPSARYEGIHDEKMDRQWAFHRRHTMEDME